MTSTPQDPSLKSTALTSLNDLVIPGQTSQPLPSPPAEEGVTVWGINHGAALDNFPQNGLQLYISPWSAMGEGDLVEVLLDSLSVSRKNVIATEVNTRLTLFVAAARLTPDNHTLQYRVTRFNQSPELSREINIWVKLDRPGGQDQDGDTPGHSALKLMLPQDIINNGVDADAAKDGVPVTIEPYPVMAEGDDIKLSWGGEFVHHKVTAVEVGEAIEITVPEATILAGGDSDANGLAVTYELYDVVDNRSEDWAAEIRIIVDTGNSRLGSPIIEEAVNNVLDLDTLANDPVTVQIVAMTFRELVTRLSQSLTQEQAAQLQASVGEEAFSPIGALKADFVMGDKIAVKLTGTTAEGKPIKYDAPEVTIENLPHIFEIPVPNDVVRQLAQTQAVFSYRLIHADNSESKSKGAFIRVIGEAVRMAAPVALDAAQGTIDPNLASTVVQIPWDESMAAGDQLVLRWIGTKPDLTIYDPLLNPHFISDGEATSKAPINFTVPGTHLKTIEGGNLELYFILRKAVGNEIVNRESARATTLNVGVPRAELPVPVVKGVIDGVIDPANGETTLTVPVYSGMAIGDNVYYRWGGSVGLSKEDSTKVTLLTLNTPLNFDLETQYITSNIGGIVEAFYWVIRAETGRISHSEVLTFNVGKPAALDPPVISSVTDSKGQNIPEAGSTSDTRVTLSGTAAARLGVEVFDGTDSKGKSTANANGQWSLSIDELTVSSHAVKAKALYGDQAESAVRTFNVVSAVLYPIITSIKDTAGNEIPDHGSTTDRTLTFAGFAPPNSQVRLLDADVGQEGGTVIATVTTNTSGQWEVSQTVPERQQHQVWILANPGGASVVRYFTLT